MDIREKQLEEDIEKYLCSEGGYIKSSSPNFDKTLGLDTTAFIDFIKTSQPKTWEKHVRIYGDQSESQLVKRFCDEVRQRDLLSVMRHGFTDRGNKFYPIFWKPETTYNQTAQEQYEANRFMCVRQLHYCPSNQNSVDIVLMVNGIPVVSMELKCQFTGQNVQNALSQYKFDRNGKDPIFTFKERILVHFAVDLTNVYMTTRLEGSKTYFLPFNQGSNGAGRVGSAGNPESTDGGYAVAYLWKNVLYKDKLQEILHKYLHLQIKRDKKTNAIISERIIFPRYHQLDVVTKLLADVKANGAGKNYLIQHSTGSGKSNSIAWLAHRLSGLHNDNNKKIFKSVIIVTDRRILDSQLQDTVYQFDHVPGIVRKIDKNSKQLQQAIEEGAGIIITTLQKFLMIYKTVRAQSHNFAVIVDEAHSSQTSDTAKRLKFALSDREKILEQYAEQEGQEEANREDDEDKLLNELAAQGPQPNLSFFAFTATPKDRTLNMFGWKDESGKYHPFHIYSMRQAIDEGFILDVLQNYMTYKMYYHIAKRISDDPELDSTAGLKAIRQYESLHPHNIAQKTTIILQHFRNVTRNKIGGRAKAMVVTASRLHAVRYFLEFKRQIKENHYTDLDVLVAFSGTVDDDGKSYTEEGMNRDKEGKTIAEKALPAAFNSSDYGMLIVAEKYQTGFDEPLLHTMFVDKKLSGVKAVQTLSRLNRTMPGKKDTFVLDFVNTAEDIKLAFEPYYEETVLEEETDPNVIYNLKNTLDEFRVYTQTEYEKFGDLFFSSSPQQAGDLGTLQSQISPAIDRYQALPEDNRDTFKTTLNRFNRIYAFITQVCRLFDKKIHKFSVFAKFLAAQLPRDNTEKINLEDKLLLEYYKLEKTFEGSIELEPTQEGFKPLTGAAGRKKRERTPLSELIEKLNSKYGTDFTEMDKVLEQLVNDFNSQTWLQNFARTNDLNMFMAQFRSKFQEVAVRRFEQNDDFFQRLFSDNTGMMNDVIETLGQLVYNNFTRRRR